MTLPAYSEWILAAILGAGALTIWYRRRRVEWIFLVLNNGLLVSSVSRRNAAALDTDLMMAMLTAIMNFTKESFSSDRPRELDYFSLGDRTVEIVQGRHAYLVVVYAGRTRGFLERNMKSLLDYIEDRYPQVRTDTVDTGALDDLPLVLKRFLDRAWLPFRSAGSHGVPSHA